MGSHPQRSSNSRALISIAIATTVLTAIVVVGVPPLATRLTAPTKPVQPQAGAWATVVEAPPAVAMPPVAGPMPGPMAGPAGPVLPPPGEQQPEDVEGARRKVEEALTTVFRGANPRAVRLSAIDDPSNLDEVMDAVRERYPEASDTSEPEMAELVFTDAEHASFLFRLRYVGAPLLPARIGTARLVEGRWMISRSTLCDVLGAAGSTCGPPAPPPT